MTKKRIKKYTIPIMLLFLVTSLFYGCTSKHAPKKVATAAGDIYQEKQLTKETLTFVFPGQEPIGVKEIIKEIEKKLEPTLNIKLNIKWYTDDNYENQVKSMIDGNQPLDGFVLSKQEGNDAIQKFVESNQLADLTDIFKDNAPNIYNNLSKDMITNVTYNGKVMAVPQLLPKLTKICAVLNDSRMKKYEAPDVTDFDSLTKALEIVAKEEGSGGDISLIKTPVQLFAEIYGYTYLRDNLVYRQDDPDMKLIPFEETSEYKQGIDVINQLEQKGVVMNFGNRGRFGFGFRFNSMSHPLDFVAGFGGSMGTMITLDEAYSEIALRGVGFDPKLRVYPLFPDKVSLQSTDTSAVVIPKTTKDPSRVLMFLNWIQSKQENYDLFMYGIKDKNYVIKDNAVDFPATVQRYLGWDGSYAFSNPKFIRNQVNEPFDFKKLYAEYQPAIERPLIAVGFKPETSSIQEFLDKRQQNNNDFWSQILTSGVTTDKDLPAFIEKQKSAGLDGILSSMQQQWDNYRSQAK